MCVEAQAQRLASLMPTTFTETFKYVAITRNLLKNEGMDCLLVDRFFIVFCKVDSSVPPISGAVESVSIS